MFAIIYIPSNAPFKLEKSPTGLSAKSSWRIDTDEYGNVATYAELETALERVKHIRDKGGEATLAAILE